MTITGSRSQSRRLADGADDRPRHSPHALDVTTGRPRASAVELVVVGVISAVLVGVRLRPLPLDVPILYGGDTFLHQLLARSADWSGSLGSTARLAAPHGLDWSVYPTSERLHLVVLHALYEATGSLVAAVNLHVWLAIVATAVVTHAVLRWLRLEPVVAGAAALLFALSPSALQRLAPGHLFLFALFPVALGVHLIVWSAERPPPTMWSPAMWWRTGWLTRRVWLVPLASACVIALSSIYYAIFTTILLIGVGAVAAVRDADARRLVAPLLLAAVVAGGTALSLAPDLLDRRDDPSAGAVGRSAAQSDIYGLRPAQMLLPQPDHTVGPLAAVGERAHDGVPSDRGAVIGLLGVAGVLVMGAAVVRAGRIPQRTSDGVDAVDGAEESSRTVLVLSTMSAVALVFATAGGGGFLLATLGLTQVRAWSRLVAFVMLASLAALGLVAQRRAGGSPRFRLAVGLVALLAFVDQGSWLPEWTANRERHDEDRALVEQLAAVDRGQVLVTQLPILPYPDQVGYERMLAPAVLADERVQFSAGGFAGGAADWQRSWLGEDPELAARAAAAAGSDVLLLARYHQLVGDVEELEERLAAVTGVEPRRTDRGSWSWFDLRPLRASLAAEHGEPAVRRSGTGVLRPIGVTYEQVRNVVVDGPDLVRDFGPAGIVVLHGDVDDDVEVEVRIRARTEAGAELTAEAAGEVVRETAGTDGRATIDLRIPLDGRTETSIRLSTDGAPTSTVSGRQVHLRVDGVRVRDAAAAHSPVLDAGTAGGDR